MKYLPKKRISYLLVITILILALQVPLQASIISVSAQSESGGQTENIVYYLSAGGSDSNDGLSAETAFATFKKLCETAGEKSVTAKIIGSYKMPAGDYVNHKGTITVSGMTSDSSISSADGVGIGFGGPVIFENITYSRGKNAYIATGGFKTVFGDGFKTSSSDDWMVFGGTQGSSGIDSVSVEVRDGNFTGKFNVGSIMPKSGFTVQNDASVLVSGGNIANIVLGSTNWGACGATTFGKNVVIQNDGGTISKISAVSSGNGSPTAVSGALELIFNGGSSAVLDTSLESISAGSRYYIYSGKGGTVRPVLGADGNAVPGKFGITIDTDGYSAVISNGSNRTVLEKSGEITLNPGITNITYQEGVPLETGKTIPMSWKPMDKGYITLIFDDNKASLPDFYNIITGEYNFPMCAAVPSSTLGSNNAVLHEIQNHGGEILSHTVGFTPLNFSMTWNEIDYQLGQSYRDLSADGFNINGIILAGGSTQDQSIEFRTQIEPFTSKYYLYSDKYGASTQYWKQRNWFSGRTVDELKSIIDTHIKNKTWEVIYAHDFNECSEETLRATLDYLKEKQTQGLVDVVTYKFVHETFGDWAEPVDFGDTTYTVEFYGSDSKTFLGKSVTVKGKSAAEPEALNLADGYTFEGWSADISNITDNMKVYALCKDADGNYAGKDSESVITAAHTYYVDSENGDNTGSGTENLPLKTINAAAALAGDSDFTVIIKGKYILPYNGFSHKGTMYVKGFDGNSILSTGEGTGGTLGGNAVISDIILNNGKYSYIYASGANTVFGQNITATGSHQLISGATYNNSSAGNGGFIEINSGSYGSLNLGDIAATNAITVSDDIKAVINGGNLNTLQLGNTGWSSTHCGVTFNGNVLVKINGGTVGKISASALQYSAQYNGAVEVIFNNGMQTGFDAAFESIAPAKGKYIVYSGEGGSVDFVTDQTGNSVPGKFSLVLPDGKYASVENGKEKTEYYSDCEIELSEGITRITYKSITDIDGTVKVSRPDGTEDVYYPSDEINITAGGVITLPEYSVFDGKLPAGWYSDAEKTKPVINKSTVEAGKIYAGCAALSSNDLSIEGVQIRIDGKPGLRFIGNITHELKSKLAALNSENNSGNLTDGIGYGTILLPQTILGENELVKGGKYEYKGTEYLSAAVPAAKTFEVCTDFDRYTAVITDIAEQNLDRYYAARAYITYKDASGCVHTAYGSPYAASMYEVADIIYKNNAENEPENMRKQILEYVYNNILTKNDGLKEPLANTLRALSFDKKLTVGYLGGSITNGYSAAKLVNSDGTVSPSGGDINLSYVNRTTAWFAERFPDAQIEFVNAGISDTATNLANYRLESTLMNKDGHDMPDLVFVEFTSNDWIYDGCITQTQNDIKRQIESLVQNIYSLNPYADIVFVFTARSENASSRKAYIEIAESYGIEYIDMGIPMQALMTARGASNESNGSYYYTVDNLHPSVEGYGVYFEQISKFLTEKLIGKEIYYREKSNKTEKMPEKPLCRSLWLEPKIINASEFELSGSIKASEALTSEMFGISATQSKSAKITDGSITITGSDAKASFSFTGTSFALIFGMNSSGFNIDYRIDGKDLKNITVDNDLLSFQKYAHTQLFVLEQELAYGEHRIDMTFNHTSDGKINVKIGGAAVSGVDNHLEKLVALTIDDGPCDASMKILDVLEKYGAHATFFCVGALVNQSTAPILKRIVESGSEIGNHSDNFNSMKTLTEAEVLQNFTSAQNRIYNAAGIYPKVFRAPGLGASEEMYNVIPLPMMAGYLDCSDWDSTVPLEPRIATLRNNAVDGRIILIHDMELNAQALEIVLPELIADGFTVVTATELYTLRGYNPTQQQRTQHKDFTR